MKSSLGQPCLQTILRSLDQNETARVVLVKPDRYRLIDSALKGSVSSIARGAGLSYSLASAGEGAVSVSMTMFDRILAFDPDRQIIEVEGGMSLGQLLMFLIEKGFWFPVLPGYPTITVGGALAMNVHGKSQFHDGLFGEQIEELELVHPDRGRLRVSPRANPELFSLTIGGLGLTGIVTRATLRVQRLKGTGLRRERVRARNLEESVELMLQRKGSFGQVYSWNDLNRKGSSFGGGYVYCEAFCDAKIKRPFRAGPLSSETRPWPRLLATLATRFINPVYRAMETFKPATQKFDLLGGAFPLNGKEIYFKAVGNRGFHETQIIVPFPAWPRFAKRLEPLLRKHGQRAALGSLKIFRGSPALLHFQMEGVCLAIDLPEQEGDRAFMGELDELMLECGGLPNLSKDSRLDARVVAAAYPGYSEFKRRLRAFDRDCRMQSALRKRIDV